MSNPIAIQQPKTFAFQIPVTNRVCKVCGAGYQLDKSRPHIRQDICFDCDFWHEKWLIKDEPYVVRVNGEHYMLSDGKQKGFGGTKFTIHFNDGRVVETDNLWHQGKIPALWFGFCLTNNAKRIEVKS